MRTDRFDAVGGFDSSFVTTVSDAKMVGRMRLVLAVSVWLAVFIAPSGLSSVSGFTWLVFLGYFFHSAAVYICSLLDKPISQSKLIHRLDVLWFALIVIFTGGADSLFFPSFFFAILISSFRWGLEEGVRVTIASAVLYAASGLVLGAQSDLPQLLLRTIFLLALGFMSAHWGESKLLLLRQLALLRDVSRLSNPRFGVDHTVTRLLEQACLFFKAHSCILVMRDTESGVYSLRTVNEDNIAQSVNSNPINAEAALPLLALSADHIVAYTRQFWGIVPPLFREHLVYSSVERKWVKYDKKSSESVADILGARSFISAPLSSRKRQGRIYVISEKINFTKADALFLSHIIAQAFPVIENIELLDNMASDAALHERKKLSLDLHDTAIQPYIGLKLGLNALRNKACADNPLITDIDKLLFMATKVIDDLRHYAVTVKNGLQQAESIFLVVLRQQAAQVREFYGIEITINMEGDLKTSDRLITEVLQLIHEGLINICKHTVAQRGVVNVQCINGWLKIHIENENTDMEPIDFMPRSISERAAELGGMANVKQVPGVNTVVYVEIPI